MLTIFSIHSLCTIWYSMYHMDNNKFKQILIFVYKYEYNLRYIYIKTVDLCSMLDLTKIQSIVKMQWKSLRKLKYCRDVFNKGQMKCSMYCLSVSTLHSYTLYSMDRAYIILNKCIVLCLLFLFVCLSYVKYQTAIQTNQSTVLT